MVWNRFSGIVNSGRHSIRGFMYLLKLFSFDLSPAHNLQNLFTKFLDNTLLKFQSTVQLIRHSTCFEFAPT